MIKIWMWKIHLASNPKHYKSCDALFILQGMTIMLGLHLVLVTLHMQFMINSIEQDNENRWH